MNMQSLRGPLGWSIASVAVIFIYCVYAITTVASPFFSSSTLHTNDSKTSALVDTYNMQVAVDISRFNGRSAFFNPIRIAPPTPPPPPVVKDVPTPPPVIATPPGPPPAPTTYTGPPLIAIIGEEAWFRTSGSGPGTVIRLKIGEEQDGLKLVKTALPSMVTVEHR